ncbi:MAG: hypothetical protein R2733_13915 [Acidimicrobiales bacterium]
MTQIDTNYSMRTAPESWMEAAEASEIVHDPTPLGRKRVMAEVPSREQPDMVSATIFGGIVALAGGWLWYRYEVDTLTQLAWLAPLIGAAIAVAVRIAGGARHSDVRATLASVLYLLMVLSVAYMVERTQFAATYGTSSEYFNSDTALLRHRISEPQTISFWLLGLIGTIHLSYMLGKRR